MFGTEKELNNKGLQKEKAVTSLIKEYKLKKFIRDPKRRILFENLYEDFLMRWMNMIIHRYKILLSVLLYQYNHTCNNELSTADNPSSKLWIGETKLRQKNHCFFIQRIKSYFTTLIFSKFGLPHVFGAWTATHLQTH